MKKIIVNLTLLTFLMMGFLLFYVLSNVDDLNVAEGGLSLLISGIFQ